MEIVIVVAAVVLAMAAIVLEARRVTGDRTPQPTARDMHALSAMSLRPVPMPRVGA